VVRILLLIDLPTSAKYHAATVGAIGHAARGLGLAAEVQARQTDASSIAEELRSTNGVVIGPGSPYRDEHAVWDVIRSARERGVPLVGT
jgi:CTP synthase (UTP-ammonia lyase)